MNHQTPSILSLLLFVSIAWAGCGTDETDPQDAGMTEDVPVDLTEDIGPDTSDTGDDTSDAASDVDAGPSTLMPRLEYRSRPTDGCSGVGGCTDGVLVNVTSRKIEKFSPDIQNDPRSDLSDDDARMLIEEVLTESTIQKMDSSWDCGSSEPQNNRLYELKGRIADEFPARRVTQDVTGCIEDDSAPDSSRVREIRDTLLNLRSKYFDN